MLTAKAEQAQRSETVGDQPAEAGFWEAGSQCRGPGSPVYALPCEAWPGGSS